MKMYKKVMAAALAGVMTVSMSATAFAADDDGYILKATNEDSKSSDNDLVIAIEGSVSSMDPANIPDTNAISATRGVYETLVSFDENQELTGKLAESWEVSDDSLTYTFKLRQGVKFQDGTDFNAAAVKANYDRVVNKDNNLRQRRTFIVTNEDGSETPRVDSIETPDDYTLVIKLTQAWAPFINRMTQFCIISPAALEEYGNDIMNHPCGTGPYVCTEWEEGDHTSFERNDDYWGDKPGVDTVTIKEVPEAGARTAMLQTGEADFIYPTPSDQIEAIKGTDDVNILTTDSNIMRYVTLNMDLEQLSDVKVRQAMNYAIDKDAYIQLMYSGYGKPATSVVPSIIGGYEEQEAYTYDVDKAKELMKEAGYEDGFKLTLWLDNVVFRLGFAQTRRDARQLVSHAHFTVNGKKVNIPSYQVKAGDVIEVRESSRSSAKFAKLTGPEAPVVALPAWLNREAGTLKGVVAKLPERSDIDYEVAEHLIVELYSK